MALIWQTRSAVLRREKWFRRRKRTQQGRNDWKVASVGRMATRRSDEVLKFFGNWSVGAGFVMCALGSPLSGPVLSTASPTASDFMMAVGLLIHVALKIDAWWESGDSR